MVICIRKGQIVAAFLIVLLLVIGFVCVNRLQRDPFAAVSHFCRFPEETFIIDAGHGGEDGGASSSGGVQEDTVNLAISQKLDALFGFYGVKSLMTRTEDISLHDDTAESLRNKKTSDLKNRVSMVNAVSNATLLSIHQNAFPQQSSHGAQAFYREDGASRLLAMEIQNQLRLFVDPGNRREVQRVSERVYLMNQVSCRAVLVECGFLSNANDAKNLQDEVYQQKIAAAIAAACLLIE